MNGGKYPDEGDPVEPRRECMHVYPNGRVCRGHVEIRNGWMYCPHCREYRRRECDTRPA